MHGLLNPGSARSTMASVDSADALPTTTQDVGAWRVTFEWDRAVATGGPSRVVIEPNPDLMDDLRRLSEIATPITRARAFDQGITTSVLRRITPVRPEAAGIEEAAKAFQNVTEKTPGNDQYLAVLAWVYAALTTAMVPNPNAKLAEWLKKSPNTIKAHVGAARERGFLAGVPNRPGGELTEDAKGILRELGLVR